MRNDNIIQLYNREIYKLFQSQHAKSNLIVFVLSFKSTQTTAKSAPAVTFSPFPFYKKKSQVNVSDLGDLSLLFSKTSDRLRMYILSSLYEEKTTHASQTHKSASSNIQ